MKLSILLALFLILVTFTVFSQSQDALVINPDNSVSIVIDGELKSLQDELTSIKQTMADLFPVGSILPYMGEVADIPDGWLLCDGSPIDPEHTELQLLIGSTTPDLRGRFLRGLDNPTGSDAAGIDPQGAARQVGSGQEDALQQHFHEIRSITVESGGYSNDQFEGASRVPGYRPNLDDGTIGTSWGGGRVNAIAYMTKPHTNAPVRTSSETRPSNIAVNFIIKY